jgi:hypothetical protein
VTKGEILAILKLMMRNSWKNLHFRIVMRCNLTLKPLFYKRVHLFKDRSGGLHKIEDLQRFKNKVVGKKSKNRVGLSTHKRSCRKIWNRHRASLLKNTREKMKGSFQLTLHASFTMLSTRFKLQFRISLMN